VERAPRFFGGLTMGSQVPARRSLATLISPLIAVAEHLDHGGGANYTSCCGSSSGVSGAEELLLELAGTGVGRQGRELLPARTAWKMGSAAAVVRTALVSTGIGMILVTSAVSGMVMPGLCPALKEKDEFDLNRFLGTWFEIFRTPFIVEYMVKCVKFHYLDKGEEQSVAVRLLGERNT
ncbi:unnamed protein product, partial [Ixodes hexagonus]